MPIAEDTKRTGGLLADVKEMKIEDADGDNITVGGGSSMEIQQSQANSGLTRSPPRRSKRGSETPAKQTSAAQSPVVKPEQEETIGGDITVKIEPGKAPKLSRTTSQKVMAKPRVIFSHLPDATPEATSVFDILKDCHYAAKYLGSTESALECDCTEEWDSTTKINHACGEDSDCINRATKMECPGDCGCGADCQNQRFQRKQYADVSVIKTDKKGYGLRANKDLKANDFIFEYIGEVISEPAFRRRMHQYDDEGIKHFYFMSLTKGEFVDATKKGNLGRFCNHSCNPNCYVDKWVVGDKLRMGIFAERRIQAGEELVFNYNVDRYGADPQPCYCGEPNCSGYIGGKTQTGERATQLSASLQTALGIYDSEDWDTAVTKKPRKKKVAEDDEEYVDSVEPKPLDMKTCQALMGELLKTEEKWVIVKLLDRIQRANDEKVHTMIAKLHGYSTFNRMLKKFMEDSNVILQVLDVLNKIPRLTRNKIVDSGIDVTIGKLIESQDEIIKTQASALLEDWSKLQMGYRIPRVKRDPNAPPADRRTDRPERRARERTRSRSRSKSVEAPKGPAAPSGPRNNMPNRGGMFFQGRPRQPYRPPINPATGLPPGWFEATDANGATYYYNASGATTWQRPTLPAMAPPPPPPKVLSDKQILDNLINSIVSNKGAATPAPAASASATPIEDFKKDKKEEKWRSWPVEKQKKLYENTLFPTVTHVMGKFKGKLDRDDLKRFAKEIAKKLVESDFKNNRVKDPSKIDAKQEKAVKKYVTNFFEKAVEKRKSHAKRKAENGSREDGVSKDGANNQQEDDAMDISDNELEAEYKASSTPAEVTSSPGVLKRRREELEAIAGAEDPDNKKLRTLIPPAPPPPPPPPPPLNRSTEDIEMAGMTPREETSNMVNSAEGLGLSIKGAANRSRPSSRQGESPMQTATPPTTGSPDDGERERRKKNFSGMNPDRLRSLGLLEGETDT